jgi:hypothetical protein
MMFASAVAGYLLLFSSRLPKDVQNLKRKAKFGRKVEDSAEPAEDPRPKDFVSADASLRRAADMNNHRLVLKLWSTMKKFEQAPTLHVAQVVEAMRRL